jgi:hypothetical protein
MKVDMSPEAITRRWRKVAELVQVCRALRIKPGSVRPVVGAAADVESRPQSIAGSDALARQLEPPERQAREQPET